LNFILPTLAIINGPLSPINTGDFDSSFVVDNSVAVASKCIGIGSIFLNEIRTTEQIAWNESSSLPKIQK